MLRAYYKPFIAKTASRGSIEVLPITDINISSARTSFRESNNSFHQFNHFQHLHDKERNKGLVREFKDALYNPEINTISYGEAETFNFPTGHEVRDRDLQVNLTNKKPLTYQVEYVEE